MTIRYTCVGCESVLKIKDDKAGTKAKCPKCKTEFVVPAPETDPEDESLELPPEPVDAPAASEEPVRKKTSRKPVAPKAQVDDEDFDPLAILSGPGSGASGRSDEGPAASDRKVSVADMMRDFDSTRRPAAEHKSSPEIARNTSGNGGAETAGSAADLLSRAYQQKRASASAPAPMSAKEVKKAEERALLVGFLSKRAIPGVLLVAALVYGYMWWMTSENYIGPPLFTVTGQVLRGTAGVADVDVTFEPVVSAPDDARGIAYATTDDKGAFELKYQDGWSGAPAGQYRVGLMMHKTGEIVPMSDVLILNVNDNGSNEFKITL
jgi:phage FluMu protein Com